MIKPKLINEIAKSAGIKLDEIENHGHYKAKISLDILKRIKHKPNAKLINITSMTPTKSGEGKTSTAIGLTEALGKLKKNTILCLREPSLGPTFGVKGGGCGCGKAQIIPMEDINLHFTRDIYAVASAHNLLASVLDNHIYHGNSLGVDIKNIKWRRVVDINDRSLRSITIHYTGKHKKFKYETGFDITASSEIMAVLALSTSLIDLKNRLSKIIVAYTKSGKPVRAKDLKVHGAMTALLKDAIKPSLVQTSEGQPAFVHTGPFANIAHGNNSFISLIMASKLADYVVTENGFGTDLGAEKFFDIVCRLNIPDQQKTLKPAVTVIVVSVKAIKAQAGFENLKHHIDNVKMFGIEPVVSINKFPKDSLKDLDRINTYCSSLGVKSVVSDVVEKGGYGGMELANCCLEIIYRKTSKFKFLYNLNDPIKEKIHKIATKVYGADGVNYTKEALLDIEKINKLGFNKMPVNIAKTHLSLSDDSSKLGAPSGWKLKIKNINISAGAGFLVPIAGKILLMPGLPKNPASEVIDIDSKGNIIGLS